jgi:hypothetical protein
MNRYEFVELHPRLYHLASDGAWPSSQQRRELVMWEWKPPNEANPGI